MNKQKIKYANLYLLCFVNYFTQVESHKENNFSSHLEKFVNESVMLLRLLGLLQFLPKLAYPLIYCFITSCLYCYIFIILIFRTYLLGEPDTSKLLVQAQLTCLFACPFPNDCSRSSILHDTIQSFLAYSTNSVKFYLIYVYFLKSTFSI